MNRPLAVLALLTLLTACGTGSSPLTSPSPTTTTSSTTTATTTTTVLPRCPAVADSEVVARAQNPDLTELSGLATGRVNPDVLWAHNDSGGAAAVYAIGPDGADLGSFVLEGATNRDWEDMAAWRDPESGIDWLYVADIGDNLAAWDTVFVYRVPEPDLGSGTPPPASLAGVESFELRYPDGPHDAETLLVDPETGTITIVTRTLGEPAQVFLAPGAAPGGLTDFIAAGSLDLSSTFDGVATAGDHARAFVLIRTYLAVVAYPTAAGDWWLAEPCPLDAPFEIQGEAIAADGTVAYFTAPEGNMPRVSRFGLG